MRRFINRACLLFLILALPAVAYGGNVGKIAGKVVDKETGQPLKFANVVVLGTPMGGMSLEDGSFFVLNVPPGTYDVQASYVGYKPVVLKGVVVKADLTQTITFELEKTIAREVKPILIQAERPLVEVDVTSTRNILSTEEIHALPVDRLEEVVDYIAGSTIDARGAHIRGGRATEIGYYIDNSPVQDPIRNRSLISLSTRAVKEMVILTGGFNAEYGNASSGVINLITHDGTDKFHGSWEHRMYLPIHMFWTKSDTGDPLDTGEIRERVSLSGPLLKRGKADLRFYFAGEGTDWDDWDPRVEVLKRPGRLRLYDGALTFRYGKTKLKGVVNVANDDHTANENIYERILVPGTWRRVHDDSYRFALTASHMLSDKSFFEATFSVLDGTREIAQPGKKWDPNLTYEANQQLYNWNLDIQRDENNFIKSGDNPYYDYQKKRAYTFRGSYTYQAGRHETKTGLDLNFYDVQFTDVFASTQNYYIYTFDVQPRSGALYAQDKLEFEGLIMNLGLRFDFFDPNHKVFKDFDHPYDPNAPDSLWHGPNGDQAPIELARYDTAGVYLGGGLVDADIKWKVSPRIGISHPISESSYLHFLYGHFFQMPSFNFLYRNEKFHTRGRWLVTGNPDLEAEKTVAYEVGVNHMLEKNTAIDFTFFYKDITDMTETVTMGPTKDSNPQGRENYVTYMNVGYGNVRGFEINVRRRHHRNWHYHAAYTFMVAKGFSSDPNEGNLRRFNGELYPSQQFYLDWDRRHSFVITAGYALRNNFSADVAVTYATGAPYTSPKTLSKKPTRNNVRFPSINNVDVEIHKMFKIFGLNTDAFLRITNLFNQRNLINWDDNDQDLRNWLVAHPGDFLGPFRDFTVYGPARNILGGVRVSF